MKHRPAKKADRTPLFSISCLAMNGLETTRKCIESAMASKEPFELLLTDNASDDGTAQYFDDLAAKDVRVSVVHNKVNLGYAEPHNLALAQARGKFFVCLNNDTEVPPGWLTEFKRPFENHAQCAITGASGSCCSLRAPWPSFHGSPGPNYEYVEGSCLCIPTALAREVTLFAPYLHFAYAEDVDLSLRVRARGYTIHPAAFTIAHLRMFTSKNIPNIREIQHRNHEVMMARWGSYHKFRRFDLPFIIRRAGAIGDVLLTTPLIAEIKKQNPRAEIFVETKSPEVFTNNSNVSKAGGPFTQYYKWATIIDLNMSYENQPNTHIVDAYFKTAHFTGCNHRPEIFINLEDENAATRFMAGGRGWIAIHPGPSTWKGKRWPWERWETLCQQLIIAGQYPLIVGQPGLALPNFLDLRGKTTFQQLAGILARCRVLIGEDSFPMHVAQCVGTPVVPLYGTSSPEITLTEGPAAPVCGTASCAGERHRVAGQTFVDCDGACMESITVEQVLEATKTFL